MGELQNLIISVNSTVVSDEEILSDKPYIFDEEKEAVMLLSDYKNIKEKETETEAETESYSAVAYSRV